MTEHEPRPPSPPPLPPGGTGPQYVSLDLTGDAGAAAPVSPQPGKRPRRLSGPLVAFVSAIVVSLAGVLIFVAIRAGGSDPSEPVTIARSSDRNTDSTGGQEQAVSEDDEAASSGADSEVTEGPKTTPVPSSVPPETAPPVTLAEGDLGLALPMSSPECNGDYVVFVRSLVTASSYAQDVAAALQTYAGSNYLRTDETGCSSLRWQVEDGSAIYAVYYGPFDTTAAACSRLLQLPSDGGAYIKVLDNRTSSASYTTRNGC